MSSKDVLKKYYSPWSRFSTYHYITDIPGFPEDRKHEFSAHTVDGAIAHGDRSEAWRVIEENNLIAEILVPYLENLLATVAKVGQRDSVVPQLLEIIDYTRTQLRKEKNYTMSDKIRDALQVVGIKTKDQKA